MTEIKEVSERLNRLSEQELATFITLMIEIKVTP
jgi:hypothetical protein